MVVLTREEGVLSFASKSKAERVRRCQQGIEAVSIIPEGASWKIIH